QFAQENGILAFTFGIARPKVELVSRNWVAAIIDQRFRGDIGPSFWKIEGDFSDQAVVIGNDKYRLTLSQQLLSSFFSDSGDAAPFTHPMQRIEIHRQSPTADLK